MSETLVLERQHRLAPIPSIEPPAITYSEKQEKEARAMQASLESYSDALKVLHDKGVELLSVNQFAKELPAFADNVKTLANIMGDISKDDIPYLWDYMS